MGNSSSRAEKVEASHEQNAQDDAAFSVSVDPELVQDTQTGNQAAPGQLPRVQAAPADGV